MDLGEKMTELENQIYDSAVSVLQQAGVPSTLGRVVMDGVYRRFVESAYNVALQRLDLMQRELEKTSSEEKKEGT